MHHYIYHSASYVVGDLINVGLVCQVELKSV